ncbi:hypothetical protein NMG60_11026298 [Bertholletia excelsa]
MSNEGDRGRTDDPFLLSYSPAELKIASEFLSNWLPFLSRDLCHSCTKTLSDRVQSLDSEVDGDQEPIKQVENLQIMTSNNVELDEVNEEEDNCDTNSLGSWKDAAEISDSFGSWKDGANGGSEPIEVASTSETTASPLLPVESPKMHMSWADMAQEDELEEDEENELSRRSATGHSQSGEATGAVKVRQKPELSREQREHIRFSNVERKKDFICLERVNGKIANILEGLELHTGVFSAAEQKRIVDFVYLLLDKGRKGELKEHTYIGSQKWMTEQRGPVSMQFGCSYNNATDKNGESPGILQNEIVDPIPDLFKVIIRRLVRWHVLPLSCVPDSCIVNIYEEGDCVPPHIDNHDFLRPFSTVSFVSECSMLFGSNLKVVGSGEFSVPFTIPLPVGSVLVLNGKSADVAKHCVPAVPAKRISITFRKMVESKRPAGFVPEPDLQELHQLPYENDRSKRKNHSKSKFSGNRKPAWREDNRDKPRGLAGRGNNNLEPQISLQIQVGPSNRRRVRMNVDNR